MPAKGLTSLPGVRVMTGKKRIEYYHVMLGKHVLLMSEGLASESFYPGPTAMSMLKGSQRREIFLRFPELADKDVASYGPRAHTCLTMAQTVAQAQAAGHCDTLKA